MGCATWPDKPIYSKCPLCCEATSRTSNVSPIEDSEAERYLRLYLEDEKKLRTSAQRTRDFERYYAARCAERDITSDGPIKSLTVL